MLKQLQDKKIENLERRLRHANIVIKELIGGLDCENVEIRALIRDVAVSYLENNEISSSEI